MIVTSAAPLSTTFTVLSSPSDRQALRPASTTSSTSAKSALSTASTTWMRRSGWMAALSMRTRRSGDVVAGATW